MADPLMATTTAFECACHTHNMTPHNSAPTTDGDSDACVFCGIVDASVQHYGDSPLSQPDHRIRWSVTRVARRPPSKRILHEEIADRDAALSHHGPTTIQFSEQYNKRWRGAHYLCVEIWPHLNFDLDHAPFDTLDVWKRILFVQNRAFMQRRGPEFMQQDFNALLGPVRPAFIEARNAHKISSVLTTLSRYRLAFVLADLCDDPSPFPALPGHLLHSTVTGSFHNFYTICKPRVIQNYNLRRQRNADLLAQLSLASQIWHHHVDLCAHSPRNKQLYHAIITTIYAIDASITLADWTLATPVLGDLHT
ncbi:hypothetical protein CYMTET_33373 [Cymbomonas tetramitiformis]|uniref:Uncharacterized protein n=1 Tax=Cymbomonas tetramitiformis TaxID=36881 RepID=A0AAE0FD88_9CHLO|nr:hypothetical protein CYMTET_33373 [Cymbomonas tetramitiformis]